MFGDARWASRGPGWRQGQEWTHNTLSVEEGPRNSVRTVQPGGVHWLFPKPVLSQCHAWVRRVPGASGEHHPGDPRRPPGHPESLARRQHLRRGGEEVETDCPSPAAGGRVLGQELSSSCVHATPPPQPSREKLPSPSLSLCVCARGW